MITRHSCYEIIRATRTCMLISLLHISISRTAVLELPDDHAQSVFIRETLEKTIRLSYYERIKEALPDEFQKFLPSEAPGPSWKFESPGKDMLFLQSFSRISNLMENIYCQRWSLTNTFYLKLPHFNPFRSSIPCHGICSVELSPC